MMPKQLRNIVKKSHNSNLTDRGEIWSYIDLAPNVLVKIIASQLIPQFFCKIVRSLN